MVTRRRSSSPRSRSGPGARSRSGSGTGYGGYGRPYRRRRRGTAASFGSAFGLALVYAVLRGSWPVRIGVVVVGVVLVAGYLWLTRSGHDGEPAGPDHPAAPTPPGPASQETP